MQMVAGPRLQMVSLSWIIPEVAHFTIKSALLAKRKRNTKRKTETETETKTKTKTKRIESSLLDGSSPS